MPSGKDLYFKRQTSCRGKEILVLRKMYRASAAVATKLLSNPNSLREGMLWLAKRHPLFRQLCWVHFYISIRSKFSSKILLCNYTWDATASSQMLTWETAELWSSTLCHTAEPYLGLQRAVCSRVLWLLQSQVSLHSLALHLSALFKN